MKKQEKRHAKFKHQEEEPYKSEGSIMPMIEDPDRRRSFDGWLEMVKERQGQ